MGTVHEESLAAHAHFGRMVGIREGKDDLLALPHVSYQGGTEADEANTARGTNTWVDDSG